MDANGLRPGIRVKVLADATDLDAWPTEPTGIIEPLCGADSFFEPDPRSRQPTLCFWVMFDEPTDDGSGDGPYRASTIQARRLQPIGEGELDSSPQAQRRRAGIDAGISAAPDSALRIKVR